MRLLLIILFLPVISFAQTPPLVKEFPANAAALSGDAIKALFTGKAFAFSGAGGDIHMKFQEANVQVAAAAADDSGSWRVEGSAVCMEFRKFKSGCNEVRQVGDAIYWKRNSNGEVVRLMQK